MQDQASIILDQAKLYGVLNFTPPNLPTLENNVLGSGVIGYQYKYTISQDWCNPLLGGICTLNYPKGCIPVLAPSAVGYVLFPIISSDSYTVYAYTATATSYSNLISAPIEGGDTYLKYNGNGDCIPRRYQTATCISASTYS